MVRCVFRPIQFEIIYLACELDLDDAGICGFLGVLPGKFLGLLTIVDRVEAEEVQVACLLLLCWLELLDIGNLLIEQGHAQESPELVVFLGIRPVWT